MEASLALGDIKRSSESNSAYGKRIDSRIWVTFSREVNVLVHSIAGHVPNAPNGYGVCIKTQFPKLTEHCYELDTSNQRKTYERLVKNSMVGAAFVNGYTGKDLVVVAGGVGGFYVGQFPTSDLSVGNYNLENGSFELIAVPGGHSRIYRDVSVVYAKNNKLLVYCKSGDLVFDNEEKFEPFVVDLGYAKNESKSIWPSTLLDKKGCDDMRIFDGYETTLVRTRSIDDGLFYSYFLEYFFASKDDERGHKSGLFARVDPIVYNIDYENKHLNFYRCGDCNAISRQYLPESIQVSGIGNLVSVKSWIHSGALPDDLVTSVDLSIFKPPAGLLSKIIELNAPICEEKPVPKTALIKHIINPNTGDASSSGKQHKNTPFIDSNKSADKSTYYPKTFSVLVAIFTVLFSIAAGVACLLECRRRSSKRNNNAYSRLELGGMQDGYCESNNEMSTSLVEAVSVQNTQEGQNTNAGFGIESSPADVANL